MAMKEDKTSSKEFTVSSSSKLKRVCFKIIPGVSERTMRAKLYSLKKKLRTEASALADKVKCI